MAIGWKGSLLGQGKGHWTPYPQSKWWRPYPLGRPETPWQNKFDERNKAQVEWRLHQPFYWSAKFQFRWRCGCRDVQGAEATPIALDHNKRSVFKCIEQALRIHWGVEFRRGRHQVTSGSDLWKLEGKRRCRFFDPVLIWKTSPASDWWSAAFGQPNIKRRWLQNNPGTQEQGRWIHVMAQEKQPCTSRQGQDCPFWKHRIRAYSPTGRFKCSNQQFLSLWLETLGQGCCHWGVEDTRQWIWCLLQEGCRSGYGKAAWLL